MFTVNTRQFYCIYDCINDEIISIISIKLYNETEISKS